MSFSAVQPGWARAAEPGFWPLEAGRPERGPEQGSSWHPPNPNLSLLRPSDPPSRWTRSSPCPNVKHGDEWGDPGKCESGDACQYCHTRTEQQFHPEVGSSRGSRGRVLRGCGRLNLSSGKQGEREGGSEQMLAEPPDSILGEGFVATRPPTSSA